MNPPARRGLALASSTLLGLALVAAPAADRIGGLVVDQRLAFACGTIPRGDYRRHPWEIRNAGLSPLKLRTRFTSGRCGFSLWLGEDYLIPAGGRMTVWLTAPAPSSGETPFSGYADIHTSDPDRPRVRFRIFGITRSPTDP